MGMSEINKEIISKSVQEVLENFYQASTLYEKKLASLKQNFLSEMKNILSSHRLNLINDDELNFKVYEILNDFKFMREEDVEEVEVYSRIFYELSSCSEDFDIDELLRIYPQLLSPKQ